MSPSIQELEEEIRTLGVRTIEYEPLMFHLPDEGFWAVRVRDDYGVLHAIGPTKVSALNKIKLLIVFNRIEDTFH